MPDRPDIWKLIEASAEVVAPTASPVVATSTDTEEEKTAKKAKWRRTRRSLDAISYFVWTYIVLQLVAFDVVRSFLNWAWPSHAFLADYRFLVFFVAIPLVGLFFWRLKFLGALAYVLLFPFILLFWKLPRLVHRRQSWLVVMVVLNVVAIAVRNLRYTFIGKGLWLLAAFVVVTSDSRPLLMIAICVLAIVLGWSSVRTVKRTLEANWFLQNQTQIIDRILDSKFSRDFMDVRKVADGTTGRLNSTQLNTVTNGISSAVITNKALYFWAYQLQKYRQARLSVSFSLLTYLSLFIGAGLTCGLINFAVANISPTEYTTQGVPSLLGMLVYGVSTLALNDGAGITSSGDAAHVLRLVAGLFGVLFLTVIVGDALLTFRRQKDEAALQKTVESLKDRARAQEADLKSQIDVGVDEARRRLETLGVGFLVFVNYFTSNLPDDFMD